MVLEWGGACLIKGGPDFNMSLVYQVVVTVQQQCLKRTPPPGIQVYICIPVYLDSIFPVLFSSFVVSLLLSGLVFLCTCKYFTVDCTFLTPCTKVLLWVSDHFFNIFTDTCYVALSELVVLALLHIHIYRYILGLCN